jgi:hypothetical protein
MPLEVKHILLRLLNSEGHGSMEDVQNYQQDELQWLQDPNQINGDKLHNVRCEAGRHFRNKEWEFMSLQHTRRT